MGNFDYITIKQFRGLNTNRDTLSLFPGQLMKNQNYLYGTNGELYERGGGSKLSDNPSGGTDPVFSLSTYVSPNGTNIIVTNQGTTAYYYDSGWIDLSLTLTSDKNIVWENAGFEANRSLYGVNGVDSVIKIIGNTPVGSSVGSSPTDAITLKLHKNRLFASNNKDTVYFTEVLDFDTWNTSDNTIEIAPGIDGNIQALEVWGDSLFIFKEHGIYVIPNADDPVPDINWSVLRTDAASGTNSRHTVRRTRSGIMYLSSDNFIRRVGPNVSFSSGEYSLGESGSPIVSFDIQDDLNEVLDTSRTQNARAISFDNLYIISFQSVNNPDSYNDLTYFADVSKANVYPAIPDPQPYWGTFEGLNFDYFTTTISGSITKLYGANGITGTVYETLNNSIHNDDGTAIDSKAILGWVPIAGEGTYKRLNHIYFSGDTENWNINLNFNMFKLGKVIPGEGEGKAYTFKTNNINGGVVGSAIVGTDLVGESGPGSAIYRMNLRGHYFTAEFGNKNADEFTRILKLTVYYRVIKQS